MMGQVKNQNKSKKRLWKQRKYSATIKLLQLVRKLDLDPEFTATGPKGRIIFPR